MKASELRSKSITELNEELLALSKERFNLSIQKSLGQLAKPHLGRQVRRNIARVKTLINEKAGNSDE